MTGNKGTEIIREKLISMKDDKYREFHSKLVPGEENIIGIRVPVMRQYAKELYRRNNGEIETLLDVIGNEFYEEIMLQGMLIGLQKKVDIDKYLKQIDEFVPKITNWGICDVFCAGLKEVKKYRDETWEHLKKYLYSSEEFYIRYGLVMLLDYYIDEEHIDDILAIVQEIVHDGYYVKMAQAWLISICFVKFYDTTKAFMRECTLDDFTYNKALQKARESHRIESDRKEELKRMKRGVFAL